MTFPGRKRRRMDAARPHSVLIRVSEAERSRLRMMASEAGISVPNLMMRSTLAGDRESAMRLKILADELRAAHRLQARIGTLLNQIAKGVNSGDPVDPILGDALEALARVRLRIESVLHDLERVDQ